MIDVNEIANIIEEKIWERHEDCKIRSEEYKEYPEKCCYLNAAHAIAERIK